MIDFDAVTPEEWDVARRVQEAVNIHLQVDPEARGFVACSMADGRSDGSLYDTRTQAVHHQMKSANESNFFYPKVHLGGMSLREAWAVVVYFRALRDKGIRPDHEEVLMPQDSDLLRGVAPRLVLPPRRITIPPIPRRA